MLSFADPAPLESCSHRQRRLGVHRKFPHMQPNAIERVLAALEKRGLIESTGDREFVFRGDVTYRATSC